MKLLYRMKTGRNHELKEQLRRDLCGRYCSYYKPNAKEELACLGFDVISGMIGEGRVIPFGEPCDGLPEGPEGRRLLKTMCGKCSFYEQDCDFAAGREGAPPCGGFVLLLSLLASGSVTYGEIIGQT
jgi:hypothetical protein